MSIGISSIPPFNLPPVDIWGRSGAADDVAAWAASQTAVQGARRHLLSYLTACYVDPVMALAEAETRFAAAATAAPSRPAQDLAAELECQVRADPALLGRIRVPLRRSRWFRWFGRKPPHIVEANLLSVPILMSDYLKRRAIAALTRSRQIEDQLTRDAVEVPALSKDAYDFFQLAAELKEPAEIIDVWTRPEHRLAVVALGDYARIVRNRLGAATPTAYLDAARRSMLMNPKGDEVLMALRLGLRVTIGVERISALVTTEV